MKYNYNPEKLLLVSSAVLSLAFGLSYLMKAPPAIAQSENRIIVAVAKALDAPKAVTGDRAAAVADVVAKALAFRALLTTTQQTALESAYTATLARRWSNLPCAGTCRNGIQLGSLTPAQLAAALEVIAAATGTTANEGSEEFNQIRLADTLLAAQGGAGGGGGGPGGGLSYGEGLYYLAFLNTPSATGPWMLQFGGHHYGANISFNEGHVVGTTPLFEALEPISFTANGNTYAPLAQERDALAVMLASLTATQLAAAKLTTTFSDTTMSPGESNGGNGTFPTTKVGLAVSTLSDAQKLLVVAAMKPWVLDMEATVAANLMAIYQNELSGTYISFTGNGVAGDASSFLNSNTNYARIDGPSVWIEFVCQSGIVFRNQIHYHTVWRDHLRDYGKDLSLTVPLDTPTAATSIAATSAASYSAGSLAAEALGTLFGTGLSSSTISATTAPWPTTLGGVSIPVKDASGTTRNAPLYFVSPSQITFQLPTGTSAGTAVITVLRDGSSIGLTTTTVESISPGLFAANANGQGVAAAIAIRVKADGSQVEEPVLQYNATTNRFDAVPLNLGDATDQLFLITFGTGFRGRSSLANVSATIGGTNANVSFAGAHSSLIGVDQANILIPRSVAGRGSIDVVLAADKKPTNTVSINVK